MKKLILIHGRSQQGKDAVHLKGEWLKSLNDSFSEAGLEMPIEETSVRFPYYGDTLAQLAAGHSGDDVAKVIVRGDHGDEEELMFQLEVLKEIRNEHGITDRQVDEIAENQGIERGVLSWPWVYASLQAIDKHVPGGSAASIALATHDVYVYLKNPGIRDVIEAGVSQALDESPAVVVAHSLGSVVAYNLLRRDGEKNGWKVPLLITVGSPLAVHAIRERLKPLQFPSCVGCWYNVRDRRDIVALYTLDSRSGWNLNPAIENYEDALNTTSNHHGISGYLGDPQVAARIHAALLT
jgi:hypothetical protein